MTQGMGRYPSPSTIKVHQVAMVGGEVAPSLWYRHDIEKVKISLAKCRNFIPMPHGSASFRPGMWYASETKDSGKVALIPMSFSSEYSIHIEAGNKYMRFYLSGQPIKLAVSDTSAWVTATSYNAYDYVNTGVDIYRCILGHTSAVDDEPGIGVDWATYWVKDSTYEIASPYETVDLDNIRYVQSANTLFILDGTHPPYVLKRNSNKDWSLSIYEFENGPFLKDNDTDDTLKVTSVSGSTGRLNETVDVTASKSMFVSSDVGRWIKIHYTQDASKISNGYENPPAAGDIAGPWDVDGKWTITGRFDGMDAGTIQGRVSVMYSVNNGTTYQEYDSFLNMYGQTNMVIDGELRADDYNGIMPKIKLTCNQDIHPFSWTLRYERESLDGLLKITSVTSATKVMCKVMKKCTYLDIPTTQWALGAWTDGEGWPSMAMFHQDRLTFARTKTSPFDIWQSVTGDYYNFEIHTPVQDDDSIRIPIRSRSLDNINGLVSLKDLIVLTSGGEWRISGSSEGNAITPDSMYISNQGYRGSYDMEPVIAGSSVLFVQRFGTRIRDLAYSFESDGYDSNDLSIFATHLFDGYTVVDWCWQQEPWNVLWVVRSDGVLLGMTYMKEQDVWAWHVHSTQGKVEAISCASGMYEDEVYIIVSRTVGGIERRYVEKLSAKAEELHLDCAVIAYNGEEPTTSVTDLGHLEGKDVVVLADGVPIFGHKVSSGAITLVKPAYFVAVGLGYTGEIQTLPMMYDTQEGISTGSRNRAVEIILQLSNSQKGYVGTDDDDMYPIHYADNGPFTGTVNELLSSEYGYSSQVAIQQREPLPFTIMTWTVRVAHGD